VEDEASWNIGSRMHDDYFLCGTATCKYRYPQRLTDCPSKPNCVSSQAADEDHAVAPLRYQGEKVAAFKRLKKIVESSERSTIVAESENYLHIECKSAIMGFVDDVEFYSPKEKVIHVRSASRLGYFDLGVNRKRVEQIRKLFAAELDDVQE
jgi:uncharacterized protein (DUF1499 family)